MERVPVRRLLGWLLFAAAFAAYVWAAPPGLYWLDSGELTAAAQSLGVAHPTGFPVLVLLGKAAALVPLGDVAFRVTLLCALSGAGCVYLLYRTGLSWFGEGGAATAGAVCAAALPGCGLTFFRQASVVEVYAPTALLLALALPLLARAATTGEARAGLSAAFLGGLGLGLHPSLRWLCAAPAGLVCLRWLVRGRRWPALAPALLLVGAGVLLELPVRAAAARPPAALWGHPRTAHALYDHLAAGRIRRAFAAEMLSRDPAVVRAHASELASMLVGELGPLAPACAALGLFWLLRRRTAAGLLVLGIGALDAVYSFWVNPMGLSDLQNGIPTHLAVGLCAGAGCTWLGQRLGRAGPAVSAAAVALVVIPAAWSDLPAKRGAGDGPDRMLHAILREAPPRASVLAVNDDINSGLLYARALGERPDVIALPRQHLWDRPLVEQVFAHAGAGQPPQGEVAIIRRLAGRGAVLWQDETDPPPAPLVAAPAAPLPVLAAPGAPPLESPAELRAQALAACYGVVGDPAGERACSSLFVGVGTTLLRAGDATRARAMLEVARGLRPDNPAALTNLGVTTYALGEVRGAAELEEAALAIDSARYPAALNAGRYRLALGELATAERHYQRAARLRPQAAQPLVGLAQVAAKMGDHARAARLIQDALSREPGSQEVREVAAQLGGR
jgi:hypothetical protein